MNATGKTDNGARLKRRWRYTVETLTPLHIGAGGDPLREDIDYLVSGKDVLVLDTERAFERIYERAQTPRPAQKKPAARAAAQKPVGGLAAQLMSLDFKAEKEEEEASPQEETQRDDMGDILARLATGMTVRDAQDAGLLVERDFDRSCQAQSLVSYVLEARPGVDRPLPKLEPPQVLPIVKDAMSGRNPYIPGSSLKGALRTVLAERMFADRKSALTVADMLDSRGRADERWADDNREREMFGRDQNRDLMRSLLVGDSQVAERPPVLEVTGTFSVNSQGRSQLKQGYFVALEAVGPGVKMSGEMSLDLYLSGSDVRERLGFSKDAEWMGDIARHCNDHAQALIEEETAFYKEYGPSQLQTFYSNLRNRLGVLREGECLLQMSWGTGWMAKTLGPKLAKEEVFPEIRRMFGRTMNRRPGATFPKTRRLVVGGRDHREPIAPMGWVLLSLEEVR